MHHGKLADPHPTYPKWTPEGRLGLERMSKSDLVDQRSQSDSAGYWLLGPVALLLMAVEVDLERLWLSSGQVVLRSKRGHLVPLEDYLKLPF